MTALAPIIDGARSASFASSFAGPNGLELVVEMAHDLRSPLSSILVLTEALQNGQSGPVNEAQRQQLGIIYSAALSLCASASDVIEMARDGGRLLDQRPSPFSVSDVLRSVHDMVCPIVDARGLDLRLVVPAIDRRMGSAHALARVFLNLTTNALRFTHTGYVELAVREVDGEPRRVECSVQDTGCGIDPEVMRALVEAPREPRGEFHQQLSSARLGLTMCRRLVASMGSTLHLETAVARGTRFWFELPLPPAASQA